MAKLYDLPFRWLVQGHFKYILREDVVEMLRVIKEEPILGTQDLINQLITGIKKL